MSITEFNKHFNKDFKSWEEAKDLLTTYEWEWVSKHKFLNYDFIHKFREYLNWHYVCTHQRLTENFIIEHKEYVNWECVCQFQKLSENFIREYKTLFKKFSVWYYISEYQKLSEEFIHEFREKLCWYYICQYQQLSENFIRKHFTYIDFGYISKYQKLSEEFIHEFKDYVDWHSIVKYQKVSSCFISEHCHGLGMCIVTDFVSWHYKDTAFKKAQVEATGLYECHEDYFIAYKGIRNDRYSRYNFQYQYLSGQIYESWCDCSSNENSFGLSVWDEKNAREYCDELVVKVKVKYEDVGRVVHNGGKIRCFKIEVLD